jgi:3' terminal RNA ribose 2'-O-methyltransferase Hen1
MIDLHETRLEAVTARLLGAGVRSVLDLGCGPGELLLRLASHPQFERIVGIDISAAALAEARQKLHVPAAGDDRRIEVSLASFTEPDAKLSGFDAGVMLETIEHIDPNRLSLVESAVFGCFRPKLVLVTTPNAEYNPIHGLGPNMFRHPDHRFEWDRPRFRRWCQGVARRNDYSVSFADIGEYDDDLGASTQMAVFAISRSN